MAEGDMILGAARRLDADILAPELDLDAVLAAARQPHHLLVPALPGLGD